MKKYCVLFIFGFLLAASSLFGLGKKDDGEVQTIHNEWVLCITAFDYSMLPEGRRITGDVITRDLVTRLNSVSYRLRVSPEYAYYESYAWQQSVKTITKSLSQKYDERSLLLYRGDPGRKYQTNLKRLDTDIAKLQEDLKVTMAEKPAINNEPSFQLCQSNTSGTYPAPPKQGTEYRFLQSQKSDAFLTGQMREFHGRYFIQFQLYTLHANAYVYEDDIIFSLEDMGGAVDEISARLTAVLSGNKPAAVAVTADPPESQILINQNYAGRGSTQAREHPPGKITVAVAAEGYSPQTVETELVAGELAEVSVALSPLLYSDINISTSADASLYHGAMYVGETPLTLRLPIEQLVYVAAETPRGEEARAVFITPDMPGESMDIALKTKIPPPQGVRRVNKARAHSYWAWGTVWLTGITAWVASGIYNGHLTVLPRSSDEDFYADAQRYYYISTGTLALLGAAVVYYFVQMPRYLYTATEGATPIVKQEKARK